MADKTDIWADVVEVIVTRAPSDSAFRTELLADGNEVLAAMGIRVPQDVTVKFVQDMPALWHFVIPAPSAEGELEDADLDRVAGGMAPKQLKGPQL